MDCSFDPSSQPHKSHYVSDDQQQKLAPSEDRALLATGSAASTNEAEIALEAIPPVKPEEDDSSTQSRYHQQCKLLSPASVLKRHSFYASFGDLSVDNGIETKSRI